MMVMGDEWNFNRQALEQAVRAFALEARFTELLELRRALMLIWAMQWLYLVACV